MIHHPKLHPSNQTHLYYQGQKAGNGSQSFEIGQKIRKLPFCAGLYLAKRLSMMLCPLHLTCEVLRKTKLGEFHHWGCIVDKSLKLLIKFLQCK